MEFIRLHLSEASTEAKASFHSIRLVVRFSVDETSTWAGTVAIVAAKQIWKTLKGRLKRPLEGMNGSWAAENKFSTRHCGVSTLLLRLPSIAIVRVFDFL